MDYELPSILSLENRTFAEIKQRFNNLDPKDYNNFFDYTYDEQSENINYYYYYRETIQPVYLYKSEELINQNTIQLEDEIGFIAKSQDKSENKFSIIVIGFEDIFIAYLFFIHDNNIYSKKILEINNTIFRYNYQLRGDEINKPIEFIFGYESSVNYQDIIIEVANLETFDSYKRRQQELLNFYTFGCFYEGEERPNITDKEWKALLENKFYKNNQELLKKTELINIKNRESLNREHIIKINNPLLELTPN